jgi:peptidoglycan hydrolase CwlO-like protein
VLWYRKKGWKFPEFYFEKDTRIDDKLDELEDKVNHVQTKVEKLQDELDKIGKDKLE